MSRHVGASNRLEGIYTPKFEAILGPHGISIKHRQDLAALDVGLHLYTPGELRGATEMSPVKVWFQLKGKDKDALPAVNLAGMEYVPVRDLPVDTVRFWLASPEGVYLVVYLEATDQFIAE